MDPAGFLFLFIFLIFVVVIVVLTEIVFEWFATNTPVYCSVTVEYAVTVSYC